jgi:hypothetical protein
MQRRPALKEEKPELSFGDLSKARTHGALQQEAPGRLLTLCRA